MLSQTAFAQMPKDYESYEHCKAPLQMLKQIPSGQSRGSAGRGLSMAPATTQTRTTASTSSFSGGLITIQERVPSKYHVDHSRPREKAVQPNPKGKICSVPRDRAKHPNCPSATFQQDGKVQ